MLGYSEFSMNIKTVVSVATFGLAAGCILSACNEDEFVTAEVPTISSADDLGDCGKKNRGQIVVIEDDNVAYECVDGDWVKLDDDEEISSSSVLTFPSSSSKKEESSSSIATNSSSSRDDSEAESSSRDDSEEDAGSSSSEEPAESSSSETRLACGDETYDPATEDCINDIPVNSDYVRLCGPEEIKYNTLTSLCARDGEVYSRDAGYNLCIYENESGDAYLPSKSFCNGLDAIPLCNGSEFNVATQECLNNKVVDSENVATCGLQGVKYDKTAQFCSSNSLYDLCDGKTYTPQNGKCENGTYYYSNSSGTYIQDLRDKQTYKFVTIGTQTWLAENIKYDTPIGTKWDTNPAENGYLYSFHAIVDSETMTENEYKAEAEQFKGICPSGWHLPIRAEWNKLKEYLEGRYGAAYKNVIVSNDALGFLATPTGRINVTSTGKQNYFDTQRAVYHVHSLTTETVAYSAIYIYYNSSDSDYYYTNLSQNETNGVAVRCVKNSN